MAAESLGTSTMRAKRTSDMPSGTRRPPKPSCRALVVPRMWVSERAMVVVVGVSRRPRCRRSSPPELGITNAVGRSSSGRRAESRAASRSPDSRKMAERTERMSVMRVLTGTAVASLK